MKSFQPLSGVRVIDLTWIVAGPQCTRILADLGAQVIKVEYADSSDYIRRMPPFAEGKPGLNRSGFFNNLNRNKLGVTVNVGHPDGMGLLKQLISISDLVIENFSSRVLTRWGLPYEEQQKLKPDIIYVSLSGFGHSGRLQDYTTWGPTAQALSGLTLMSGLPGHMPAGWGYSFLDHTAGYYGALAVLMALHHRHRTGQGQFIDIAQIETGIVMTGPAILDYTVNGRRYRRPGIPPGNRSTHPRVAPHNVYRCRGHDQWCAITVFRENEWQKFCKAIGQLPWTRDSRFATNQSRVTHEEELDALIENWTKEQDARDVMAILQAAGVAAGVVQTSRDKLDTDPQLRAREFFPAIEHPEIGTYEFEGFPTKFSLGEVPFKQASPVLGQDNELVFKDLLGLDAHLFNQYASEAVF
ncbi:CoA transferase [Dehalococcoidia bacterium]|nr:CoA transferase [Dehalococcoidia bacterium]